MTWKVDSALIDSFPTRRGSAAGPMAVLGVVLAAAGFACTARSPLSGPRHALSDGQRRRLGIVTGMREATYILPWPTSRELRIEIDLLAGPECTTRLIMADPGDIIFLEIRSRLLDDPDCFR